MGATTVILFAERCGNSFFEAFFVRVCMGDLSVDFWLVFGAVLVFAFFYHFLPNLVTFANVFLGIVFL